MNDLENTLKRQCNAKCHYNVDWVEGDVEEVKRKISATNLMDAIWKLYRRLEGILDRCIINYY